jgi:NDP-sugar pyrophosphorylase family protein
MKVVIPMAGLGTRFAEVSEQNPLYKKPKPFIPVHTIPMVRWATGSLPHIAHADRITHHPHARVQPKDLVFIILKEHNNVHHLASGLREIYSDAITVIELPTVTRGAAETAYAARPHLTDDEELLITDSDHYFDGTLFMERIAHRDPRTVGVIPVFRARNEGIPKWSYSLLKEGTNQITQVAEKDRTLMEQGAHANIGAYYFSQARYFFETAAQVITHNKRSGDANKAEFYIAPLYQDLIDAGHRIEAAVIPEVWGLGTPSDLEYFLEQYLNHAPQW